jgi:DNA-binding CsgD family transcriptional regulator
MPYFKLTSDDVIVQAVAAFIRPTISAAYRNKHASPRGSQREGAIDPVTALNVLRTRGYGTIAALLDALARKSAMVVAAGVALTRKETEVLLLMAQGLPAAEIAATLHNSLNTIQTHQKHIFQKLGVNDRLAAVNQGRALGLV